MQNASAAVVVNRMRVMSPSFTDAVSILLEAPVRNRDPAGNHARIPARRMLRFRGA
jgi:hypothetical protein